MSVLEDFKKLKQKEKLERLRIWDIEYYQNDNPSVSDADYDACLASYNAQYKKKYTSALGKASDAFTKYTHEHPVLSLEKVTTPEGYEEAVNKLGNDIVIQPKLDGLTVVYYPDGKLVSRGNGHVGEILPHAHLIPGLPAPLDKPVRMEVVIRFEDLQEYFPDTTKNARNIAAGILRRKERSTELKYLSYYAYNILGADDMTEGEQIDYLDAHGFITPETIAISGAEECQLGFKLLHYIARSQSYPTDGAVVKANVAKKNKDFGGTSHHPNNAFAYKFVSAVAETTVTDIEWSVGRGKFTPVAVFEPVELGGSTVTRASLHNLNIVYKLGVKIGSKVKVTLKNEIIPQIIESDNKGIGIREIKKCPCCGGETTLEDNGEVYCKNFACDLYTIDSMNKMVSKNGLDIEGMSEETIGKLFNYVKNVKKKPGFTAFELLSFNAEDFEGAGFTPYMANKLAAEMAAKVKNVPLDKFIFACNIPGVGVSTAKDIARHYKDINDFYYNWENTGMEIDGIGQVTFDSVTNHMEDIKGNLSFISFAPENKLYCKGGASVMEGSKLIVITGKLSKSKSYYENLIVKAGHRFSDSFTKTTDILVAADPDGGSAKLVKARKNGIPVISEAQLLEMLA